MAKRRISESTVRRLSQYLRLLRDLERRDRGLVSSRQLAAGSGTTAAQVRKDLSHFGSFGKRGKGYPVVELRLQLEAILGLRYRWRVAVIGAGKIGTALLGYRDLAQRGFDVVAAFDVDPTKVGSEIGGIRVHPIEALETEIKRRGVGIVILATPPDAAQQMAQRAVRGGASAILNFAPVDLELPAGIALRTMDVTLELEGLCFAVTEAGRAALEPRW